MHSGGSWGEAAEGTAEGCSSRGKLSGHLACNEKCTDDMDVKGGLYFRGNWQYGRSRETESAALRHRVTSQSGSRPWMHLSNPK